MEQQVTATAAPAESGQQLTDIQNYLASFQQEIQPGSEQQHATTNDNQTPPAYSQAQTQIYATTPTYYTTATGQASTDQPINIKPPITTQDASQLIPQVADQANQQVGPQQAQQPQMSLETQQAIQAAAAGHPEGTIIQVLEGDAAATMASLQGKRIVKQVGSDSETIYVYQEAEEESQNQPGQQEGIVVTAADTQQQTQQIQGGQEIADENTLQMMADLAEQAAAAGDGQPNSVILNTGHSYQTVTIVPSDSNPGEVSYVLIVSQPEDGDIDRELNLDTSVYDFTEGVQHTADGRRILRVSPKKIIKQVAQSPSHMCNYCNYTSPKRYLLHRHMKSHSEERPHKCNVCERGFKTLASLQNHLNTHTGTRPHICKECNSSFTTSGELVRHMRYKHTHEKPHKCTECDYASVELSKLKRHMRCHTGERPYQCPHCTYASPDTFKLKRHLRVHTGEKPYECDVCHARFTQSNSLKSHRLIHSGAKPQYQCELCPTTCGRKTDLRIHVQKLHTSDKPLKCKKCGKNFPDRYTFKIHVKTHDGEKCFKCDLCSYASLTQRHLESHMLIHTDQKPFQCDECDQSFRQKQLLKRHKNLYHDPNYVPPVPKEKTHQCPECGKLFRHKGNLIRHLAIHDPDASPDKIAELNQMMPGEEDDECDDDEYAEQMEIPQSVLDNLQEGQQVILINVSNAEAAAEAAEVVQAVAEASGETTGPSELSGLSLSSLAAPNAKLKANMSSISLQESNDSNQYEMIQVNGETQIKRARGRPRKVVTTGMLNGPTITTDDLHGTVDFESSTNLISDIASGKGDRVTRKKVAEEDEAMEMDEAEEELDSQNDAESQALKTVQEVQKREELKQKSKQDMENAFGFDDVADDSRRFDQHEEPTPEKIAMILAADMATQ